LQIMLFACAKVVPGRALGPVWLVVALGTSIALAAALYLVVERPMERRLRGAADTRTERAHVDRRPVVVRVLRGPAKRSTPAVGTAD
jgi:peptidoglycan/LPS O-acetylase OafA/YrhL